MTPENPSWLPEVWHDKSGAPLSCKEKIKVLEGELSALRQEAQDVFEDALLMGCDDAQVRDVMDQLLKALENPYQT